jgi:hypothetical protein
VRAPGDLAHAPTYPANDRGPDGARRVAVASLALVPLLLALAWRIGELALPQHAEHAWRDADGLGIARCFVREGLGLLEPRIVERGAGSGIVGMELPLVNAAGGVLMKLGGVHDWLARRLCWLALVPFALGGWALEIQAGNVTFKQLSQGSAGS